MSSKRSQTDIVDFSDKSHRSWPEQLLGLGIYLVVSFGVDFLHRWFLSFYEKSQWPLNQAPWVIDYWPSATFGTLSLIFISLSMWGLWRCHSLKRLKLELSFYLTIFAGILFWSFSFFAMKESLLGLITLLLLWPILLSTAILFWKKDRLSSQLLALPFFWILYLGSLTMVICTKG